MIDYSKNLTIGEKYILDSEYRNSSIVKLIIKGKIYGLVESEEGTQWEVMLNRLSPIKN